MSEDHGMKERKMDNLNRMMIEANSYLEEKDQMVQKELRLQRKPQAVANISALVAE